MYIFRQGECVCGTLKLFNTLNFVTILKFFKQVHAIKFPVIPILKEVGDGGWGWGCCKEEPKIIFCRCINIKTQICTGN